MTFVHKCTNCGATFDSVHDHMPLCPTCRGGAVRRQEPCERCGGDGEVWVRTGCSRGPSIRYSLLPCPRCATNAAARAAVGDPYAHGRQT